MFPCAFRDLTSETDKTIPPRSTVGTELGGNETRSMPTTKLQLTPLC